MRRVLLSAVLALALIGVTAGLARTFFTADLAGRGEPQRKRLADALDRHDPPTLDRAREVRLVDSRYAAHPGLARMHVIPGAIIMLLAPFQLSYRIRSRKPRLHHWAGRIILACSAISLIPLGWFGIVTPYAGSGESLVISLAALLYVVALGFGYAAIRRKDVARHREWMLRAVSVILGVALTRPVGVIVDLTLVPMGYSTAEGLVLTLWIGWIIAIGTAEVWIRRTRGRVASYAAASVPA
jgi:hypothetical protein